MPPSRTAKVARKQNLAISRPTAMAVKDQNNKEQCMDDLRGKYKEALQKIVQLNELLMVERNRAATLQDALGKERLKVSALEEKLDNERTRSKGFYSELRVARRSLQRGKKKKESLQDQMNILRSAALESSKKHKDTLSSANHAIESLIRIEKENEGLKSDLSLCFECSIAQAKTCGQELRKAKKELSKCKKQVYRLKGCCKLAASKRETAVTRAEAKVLKQRSVHKLMNKGVYTEDTRNLIRLLVKAGCSRDYIGEVLKAVLKTAGITAIGSPSQRTVSQVLVEGWIASQIQLGYEMIQTEC